MLPVRREAICRRLGLVFTANTPSFSRAKEHRTMFGKQGARVAGASLLLVIAGLCVWAARADKPNHAQQRQGLTKSLNDGNFKVAYEGFRKLALDLSNDPKEVSKDLDQAIT